MFHFCVLTVERAVNKTKLSFMEIFVYLISFIRGTQDVYQHHIWRLAGNNIIVIIQSKFGVNESLK